MYLAKKGEMKRFLGNEAQVAAFKNAGYEISEIDKDGKSILAEPTEPTETVEPIETEELIEPTEPTETVPKKPGRPRKD